MTSFETNFEQGSLNLIKLIIKDSNNYKFLRTDLKTVTSSGTELICYALNGERMFRIVKSHYAPRRDAKASERKETQYAIEMLGRLLILNTQNSSAEKDKLFKIIDKKITEIKPNVSPVSKHKQNVR